MRRLAILVGACVLAVGLLTACSGFGGPPGEPSGTPGTGATADQLIGTWVVDARFDVPTQPFLTIRNDGTWAGSDGCNGVQGTWKLGDGGSLEVEAGPSTLIYCDGKPLPSLFAHAKTAAVAGDTLTLHDAAGEVTATLISGREELKPLG